MKLHISGQYRADHQLPHVGALESRWPVSPENLGVCGAVEGFQNRAIVVELRERSVEGDEEGIVDSRMPNIMSNGCDQEGKSLKGSNQLGDG